MSSTRQGSLMLGRLTRAALSTLIVLTPAASRGWQTSLSGAAESQVRQWAISATASTQYSASSWSAAKATGPPDTTGCGDIVSAWAPAASRGLFGATPNGPGPEWLQLTYAKPVHAVGIRVHETYMAGFVYQVDLTDTSGVPHTVWSGGDATSCPGWLEIEFPATPYLVTGVTLHTAKPGYEEVDAVELVGELQASFSISGAPPGARVFLDNRPVGAIAGDGSLSANASTGSHRVRVTADGFQDWSQEVTLNEDSRVNLEARMSPKTASLTLLTKPGQAQVYLDDEPRGVTSSEGRLVLRDLKPGSYRMRLSLTGYKEWTQTLTLAAGDALQLEAKLESAGPKPLTLGDVEQALTGGLSKARVATLVKEYGVDFALNDDAEKLLRAAGADGDLLLAISKARK